MFVGILLHVLCRFCSNLAWDTLFIQVDKENLMEFLLD